MNRATFVALTLIALTVSQPAKAQQRSASLAQQKMCADQAKKVFREIFAGAWDSRKPGASTSNDYVSHYDPRANVCYMMTHSTMWVDHLIAHENYRVSDAFEQREFAAYAESKGNNVVGCYVVVDPVIHCKTESEFVTLVKKYFGISF